MKRGGKIWPRCECGASHSKHIGELPSDCPDGYRPRKGFKRSGFKTVKGGSRGLKAVSDHRKRLNVAYEIVSEIVKEFHGGLCAVCMREGIEIHHIEGRNGFKKRLPLLVNPLWMVWICRTCHEMLGRKKDDPRSLQERADCARLYYKIVNQLPEMAGAMLVTTEDIIKAVRSIRDENKKIQEG